MNSPLYENNNPMNNYTTHSLPSSRSKTHLSIGSLNCRSLSKLSDPEKSSLFIRYLNSLKYDILCVQESHAIESVQNRLNMQFHTNSSIWTPHCGIISLNPLLTLESLNIDVDQRLIICQVTHQNALFPPITIANIYAPASPSPRFTFFQKLLDTPFFNFFTTSDDINNRLHSHIDPKTHPILVLGDFNYHALFPFTDHTDYDQENISLLNHNNLETPRLNQNRSNSQRNWHNLLNNNFFECTHSRNESHILPTFRRGNTQSTIDYIYSSPFLLQHFHSSSVDFINNDWTDHALLSSHFVFSSDHQGPGLWRANPQLAGNKYFQEAIHNALDQFFDLQPIPTISTPQEKWEEIKNIVRKIAL